MELAIAERWLSPRPKEAAAFVTGIRPAKQIREATVRDEMRYFLFDLAVDAVFTDNPDQFPAK